MPVEYPRTPPTSDERTLAILSHLLTIVPGFGILGPFVIWLIKRNEFDFARDNAEESVNYQLAVILGYIICGVLAVVAIGLLLFVALSVMNLVFVIKATITASENKIYRYPFKIKLLR